MASKHKSTTNNWLERLGLLPAVAVFLTGIVVTLILWRFTTNQVLSNKISQLEEATSILHNQIDNRILQYQGVMRGARGFFVGSDNVNRLEWRRFVESLELEAIPPDVSALAFVAAVDDENLDQFIDMVRSDNSDPQIRESELANFTVRPPGLRDEYYVPIFIEPFNDENKIAFGSDLRTNDARRRSFETARDSGEISLTPRIMSITTGEIAFSMYVPIYRDNPQTIEERRQNLQGFILTIFETGKFFSDLSPSSSSGPPVDYLVFDNPSVMSTETPLYASNPEIASVDQIPPDYLSHSVNLPLLQSDWRVITFKPPSGPATIDDYAPALVLISGTAFSMMLFVSMAVLSSAGAEANKLAEKFSQRLSFSEQQYQNIFRSLHDLLLRTDGDGNILLVSLSAERYFHRSPDSLIGKSLSDLFVDQLLLTSIVEQIKKNQPVIDKTVALLGPNGKQLNMSLNAYLVPQVEDDLMEIEWVLRDVSARLEAERTVSQRAEDLERLNRIMVNREKEMIALKEELNKLKGLG